MPKLALALTVAGALALAQPAALAAAAAAGGGPPKPRRRRRRGPKKAVQKPKSAAAAPKAVGTGAKRKQGVARLQTPAAAGAAAALTAQQGPELRVGVEGAYPPFSEVGADGELKGFDIDVANALCEEMRVRCRLERQGWDRIQDGLLARETDFVVASLSVSEERRQRYAFTNRYYHVPGKFVARQGGEPPPAGFDEVGLRGARIGVQQGTAHAAYLAARYGETVRTTRYPSVEAALDALGRGEVALVLADALVVDQNAMRSEAGRDLRFVGPDLLHPDWFGEGAGIAVRKEDAALRERLDGALARLHADGRYRAIAGRYFGFDISGTAAPPREERRVAGVPPRPERDLPQLIDGPNTRNR
jgi:arginine/ornithine transport system substrate-binding protein